MPNDHEGQSAIAQQKVENAKAALADAISADAKKKAGLALKEAKKELKALEKATPKPDKYENTLKGEFVLPGIVFKAGEAKPVSKEIQNLKKFKHAVHLEVLKLVK